jgi:Caspase domain
MSRRRHALVIGIDEYPGFGPEDQLAGAVRDALIMEEVLVSRHGFASGDVLRRLGAEATRRALLDSLESIRGRVGSGDQVVFFFSGHGSQVTDRERDEGDGLDETLVPFDSGREDSENRDVTDDEINYWAAGILEKTPHLTLIFDCCHSATLHRPGWRVRSVPPDLRPIEALPPSPIPVLRDVETGPRPLLLSACRDDERAYELPPSIAGDDRGAFSLHLIEALRDASPRESWRQVFARTASALAVDCPEQHPQMSGDGLDEPLFGGRRSGIRAIDRGRQLVELAGGPNRFGLAMELYRSRGGAWRRSTSFIEGDRLRVDLRHGHERELFVYLFDVGLTGAVTLLFPDPDGHEILDPGTTLSVGGRRGDALDMVLPRNLPADRPAGVGHLVLVACKSRLSTAGLVAGPGSLNRSESVTSASYRLRRA